jgi:hypothetical protein
MAKLERSDKPVSVLLEEFGRGKLGLPEIQRGYVWNKPQTRDLIDSLYHEYPSGLILLWKPPNELPELRKSAISGVETEKPEFLILDGQQRLTSLKKVFDGEIDVYFNVEDESFEIYSPKLKANPLWVSVKEVVNKGAVEVWLKLKQQLESHSPRIGEMELERYLKNLYALEKIKDYRYPVMIIHTEDYDEVTESFIRVNSKGTRLKEAELAMARLALLWPGVLVEEFENALDDYGRVNYNFEARFLMRCYVAIATGQSRFKNLKPLWNKKRAELEEIWKRTKESIDSTVNFLKNNAGIESLEWIPSVNALVPLVVYFSKKQGPLTEEEVKGLLFWFFEATIHGRFTGSPETKIDQDLKAVESAHPIDALVANLKKEIPSFDITSEMIEGKYERHPFLPLIFIIFREKKAEDWFTGTVLSSTNVGPKHQLQFHHIFPKALLKKSFPPHDIDDIANIAFLSQEANKKILNSKPEDYLCKIEKARLEAQCVPMDKELWKVERFKDFLKNRRNLLKDAINKYLRAIGRVYFNV